VQFSNFKLTFMSDNAVWFSLFVLFYLLLFMSFCFLLPGWSLNFSIPSCPSSTCTTMSLFSFPASISLLSLFRCLISTFLKSFIHLFTYAYIVWAISFPCPLPTPPLSHFEAEPVLPYH
jgi:hypothetical protein